MESFEKYEKQGEPVKAEKAVLWQTAIGLQKTDGLEVSEYLIETAKKHIEGDITIEQAKNGLEEYYKEQKQRNTQDRTEEADKVSARIMEILAENTFWFNPEEFVGIHKRLFEGIYDHAGVLRKTNITKGQIILDGDTVVYLNWQQLRKALDYDFNDEKSFDYKGLGIREIVERIAEFTRRIWQIHPFEEGNTRTTAVFIVKYLRTKGFEPNWEMFKEHSWYFRNSLVRANYEKFTKGIYNTNEFLMKFFGNLLLNEKHELKNRDLMIASPKDKTQEEIKKIINENPNITQGDIAKLIGKSSRTIKTIMKKMQDDNIIKRTDSKKTGHWKVIR